MAAKRLVAHLLVLSVGAPLNGHPVAVTASDVGLPDSQSPPHHPPQVSAAENPEERRRHAWREGHPCRESCLEEHRRLTSQERLVLDLVEPERLAAHDKETEDWQRRIDEHWKDRRGPFHSQYVPRKIDLAISGFKTLKNLHMGTMMVLPTRKEQGREKYLWGQNDKRQGILKLYLADRGVTDEDQTGGTGKREDAPRAAKHDVKVLKPPHATATQAPAASEIARKLPHESTFADAVEKGALFQEEWPQGVLKYYNADQRRAIVKTVTRGLDLETMHTPHEIKSMHLEPWRLESEPDLFEHTIRRERRRARRGPAGPGEALGATHLAQRRAPGHSTFRSTVQHALGGPPRIP